MKCYHFQNYYLASTQAGLQSAHSQHRFTRKYYIQEQNDPKAKKELEKWIMDYETIIVLNGGGHQNLVDLETFLKTHAKEFAWTSFRESQEALNGSMTNVAIILPDYIYENRELASAFTPFVDFDGNLKEATDEMILGPIPKGKNGEWVSFSEDTHMLTCYNGDLINEEIVSLTLFEAAILQRISFAKLM